MEDLSPQELVDEVTARMADGTANDDAIAVISAAMECDPHGKCGDWDPRILFQAMAPILEGGSVRTVAAVVGLAVECCAFVRAQALVLNVDPVELWQRAALMNAERE